jgi:hypothetical protein
MATVQGRSYLMSTWTRLFDTIITDPKYWALSSDAFRVLICTTVWCNTQLTDGAFDTDSVAMSCSMLSDDERNDAIDELEQGGFISADGDGFVISAYADEQQTALEIERKRKQGRERSKRHFAGKSVKSQPEQEPNALDSALATLPDTERETEAETDSLLLEAPGKAFEDEEPCESCIASEIESRRKASTSTIVHLSAWTKTLQSDPEVIKAATEACAIHRMRERHADCDRCQGSAFLSGRECLGPLTADELVDQRMAAEESRRVGAAEAEHTAALVKATAGKHGAAADPATGICHRCEQPADDLIVHLSIEEADTLAIAEQASRY